MSHEIFTWWEPDDMYVRYCRSPNRGVTWETPVDYDFYIQTSYVGAHVSGCADNTIWYQYCGAGPEPNYLHFHSSIDGGKTWQDYELAEILPGTRSQSSCYIDGNTLRMVWCNNRNVAYPALSNRIYYGTGVLSAGKVLGFTTKLITQLNIAAPVTKEFEIIDGDDDVLRLGLTGFEKDGTTLYFGNPGGANVRNALRFGNITIPKNSVIWSAILTYKAGDDQGWTPAKTQFFIEDVDDARQIDDYADFDDRILWYPIDWNIKEAWVAGEAYTSPNIAQLIQHAVDRDGWASGNALQIFNAENGSKWTGYRAFDSFEGGTPVALSITYSPAAPDAFDRFYVEPYSSQCDLCWSGDTIYAAWCTSTIQAQNKPGKLWFSKSIDNGITWSEPLKIFDTDDLEPFTRCKNARIERDSEGRLIILMGLGYISSMWQLMVSEDDGETWLPRTVALGQGYYQGTLNIDSADNVYVAYISNVDYKLYVQKSTDHAVTFSDPMAVTSFTRDWYHDVAIASDDSIHVLTNSGYPDRMYHHLSKDGGQTFGDPHLIDDSEVPYGTGARLFVGIVKRRSEVQFLLA